MISQPMTNIVSDIATWGKKNGKKIVSVFSHEGDWTVWARVEVALALMEYENVLVTRNRKLDCGNNADLLLEVEGKKNIVIMLGCEVKPGADKSLNAIGDENAYQSVLDVYQNMSKSIDLSKYQPVVMGIMVSTAANDTATVYLCDKQGFRKQSLFQDKAGNDVGLYYKEI